MWLTRRGLFGLSAGGVLLGACGQAQASTLVSSVQAPPVGRPIQAARATASIEAIDDSTLQRELNTFLRGQEGAFGVAIQDLRGPVRAVYDAADRFQLGSLYKLVLMAEVFRQARAGRISLDAPIQTLPEYLFGEPPGGLPPSTRTTVLQALGPMIAVSSNAAALALIELVGPEALTTAPRRLGLQETAIDVESVGGPGSYLIDARGSAQDALTLLVKLDREQLIGPEQDRRMLDLLLRQRIADRIPLLLPKDVPIAHKTADLDSYTHDAGLVYVPGRPYAIAILAQGLNLTDGKAIVAEVSRLTYAFFDGRR